MKKTIGILGLQGDFSLHQQSLIRCGVDAPIIRNSEELMCCNGLILPGGESTTFVNLLRKTGMVKSIRSFSKTRSVMGTCAGLITLASKIVNDSIETLDLIDLEVQRNAYGRQVDSFIDSVRISILKDKPDFEGVFIRAPKILSLGNGTEAIGFHGDDIVMARNDRVLVMTFHPELTQDLRIHHYFIKEML
jgi:5'-phosphate synthase pdxT subunit